MLSKSVFRFTLISLFFLKIFTANALDTGVSYSIYTNGEQHYIEINIEIAAASVTFKAVDSTRLQAGVETLILIKQGEKVQNFEKYLLNSPITERPETLLDVKRMALPNGKYELEITFVDKFDSTNRDVFKSIFEINFSDKIHLSEIQLLRDFKPDNSMDNPFVKNGYFLEPLPFNFYNRMATRLAFYAEIYNSNKIAGLTDYAVRSVIEQQMGNNLSRLVSVGTQKKKVSDIDAVLIQMDISNLVSGNYLLTVELRNRAGELLAERKLEFQRSNPFKTLTANELTPEILDKQFTKDLDEETLRYAIRAAAPNAENDESETIKLMLKGTDLKPMRLFLFNFFVRRDANNPELEFNKYMETARAADKTFKSGFGLGFETDRGRTFMKYGRPDDLVHVEDDPAAPPYEIWVYYNFPKTKQTNVKFLFYNPTLAGADFITLHSNARGEINNPRWERELYRRNAGEEYQGDNYHDATKMQGNFNRNARRYFEDL